MNVTFRRVRLRSCRGKTISVTYSEYVCVRVVLVIQHAVRMRHIVVYVLSGPTIFLHIIT